MDLIPILDKYKSALKGIKGKRLYTALIEIIPKGKYEYIQLKKKKGVNYNPTFIGLLVKEYGCSITTSKEYIDIYIAKGVELEEFNKLKGKYGMK